MKKPPITALLGLLFLFTAVLAAASCGRDNKTGSAASQPTATSEPTALATATPSPTQSPAPTVSLGPVHSLELPRDDLGYWFPMDLLQGTTTFVLEYTPESTTDDQMSQEVSRLALFDPETGKLEEFRTLNPGDQAGSFANDGRFLVWVESRGGGSSEVAGWGLYALDTATGDVWQVDSDPGIQIVQLGEPCYTPDIAVSDGRLIYFALTRNGSGTAAYETVSVDLRSRTRTILAENGDAGSQILRDPSLSGNMLVWTKTLLGEGPTPLGQFIVELHFMDLSSGETRVLAQGIISRWPLIRDGKVLYSTLPSPPDLIASMHMVDVSTGVDQTLTATEPSPGSLTLVNGLALWDASAVMLYDIKSGELMMLSEPYSALLFAANQRIYWEWNQPFSGGPATESERTRFYLQWVDLPSP